MASWGPHLCSYGSFFRSSLGGRGILGTERVSGFGEVLATLATPQMVNLEGARVAVGDTRDIFCVIIVVNYVQFNMTKVVCEVHVIPVGTTNYGPSFWMVSIFD